jgi:outer membrane protein TolC
MTPGRPAVQLADQNWATSQAARATIASFTAAVRAAQIVVGLQEEALTGTRTVLDVLVDERQRFTTQAQLVTAERDTAIRRVQMSPSTGGYRWHHPKVS